MKNARKSFKNRLIYSSPSKLFGDIGASESDFQDLRKPSTRAKNPLWVRMSRYNASTKDYSRLPPILCLNGNISDLTSAYKAPIIGNVSHVHSKQYLLPKMVSDPYFCALGSGLIRKESPFSCSRHLQCSTVEGDRGDG